MNRNINFLILSALIVCLSGLSAQNQDFVQPTNGPEGIWARQIAVDPSNGNLFLCAQDGSYYYSRDQGASWIAKSKRNYNSQPMIVTDWGTIFIGESHIFKSEDLAGSWQEANEGMPSSISIYAILFDQNSGEIYAGTTKKGIYVSADSGATWIARNDGLTDFASTDVTSLYQHTNGDIYATTTNYSNGHIFRWDTKNRIWIDLSGPLTGVRSFTDLTVTTDNRIFVTTWSGLLYRSDDGGVTWNEFSNGISDPYMSCITALPDNVVLVGTLYEGVYRSENFGASWTLLQGSGLYGSNAADMTYDYNHGYAYIAMRNAGLFRSDAAGNIWQPMNKGLRHVTIDDLVIDEDNVIFAAGWGSGVYRSTDQGDSWQWIAADFAKQSVLALASKPGYLFAGTQADGIYRSSDKGDSWYRTSLVSSSGWIVAMTIGPEGSVLAGNTQGILHRSTDNGNTWDTVYDFNDEIMDIGYNPHSGHLFVAVDDPSYGGVYRSTDGGTTWNLENNNFGSVRALSVAVMPGDSAVYASTADDGIYISSGSRYEMRWDKPVSAGLPKWIQRVAVNSKGEIFAGGNYLYHSRDGGLNFEAASLQPNSTGLMAMAFDRSEVLYIGTDEMSVWRSAYPTTARKVSFAVKMKYEDGFDPSSQQVVVRGLFNQWGGSGDWVLSALDDADMTYEGTFTVENIGDILTNDNLLQYKYIIPPDGWEIFAENHEAEWDGVDDLNLPPDWFSNQKEFTRMTTTALTIDQYPAGGCAWADFDNDGDDDLFITHEGSTLPNELFINQGNGDFTKLTSGPLPSDIADSRAGCWGDYNNDGWLDLYVCNYGQNNFLYKGDGSGNFTRIDAGATTSQGGTSVGAVWADFNQDGFLDLFVTNNNGENNFLYRNNGDETFTTITTGPVVTDGGSSLGCTTADIDNDGDMDLFVANIGAANSGAVNFLYRNDGNWTFTRITTGPVAEDINSSSGGSWGDVNNDGWLDLFVTNVYNEPNRLYLNDKSGGFLLATTDEMNADSSASMSSAWMDVNNDGWLDLFVANSGAERNTFYLNNEDGALSRIHFGPLVQDMFTDSWGAAWADYDSDGDADLFLRNHEKSNSLYRNNMSGNTWLQIRLEGPLTNSTVLGAQVIVKTKLVNEEGSLLLQRRTVEAQSGLMGQNSPVLHFGMRQETLVDSVIIIWPDGLVERKISIPTNQVQSFRQKAPPPVVTLNSPKDSAINVPVPPTLSWLELSEADKYWIRVSEALTFSSMVKEDSMLSVNSLVIDEADLSKTYYWQVCARNESGWGEWSEVWKFTTASQPLPPDPPTLVTPHDGETGIGLPPTVKWNQAGNATQYYLQVAYNNSFTSSALVEDDSSIAEFSYELSSLSYGTTYFWRVSARNAAGWSNWSKIRSFTTEVLTENPDPPRAEDPPDGQTKIAIPALLSWYSPSAGSFTVEVCSDQGMTNVVFSKTVPDNSVFVNSGLDYSTTYYWHVKITINSFASTWSSASSFTTYDDIIQVSGKDFYFPSHTRRDEFSAQDYILFGLPGHADKLLTDILGSADGETWMAYWDNGLNGTPQDYFVGFDGTDKFRLRKGTGYWLIHNGTLTVNESLPITPLNQDAMAEIPVHDGFNIITCPFDVPVDWEEVLWTNDLPLTLKLWRRNEVSKAFEETSRLEPYRGYYIYLESTTSQFLQIPYVYPQPLTKKPRKDTVGELNLLWQARIILQSGEFIDRSTCFGTASDAKEGLDRYEYRKPRAPGHMTNIYFNRPQWDRAYPVFASDIRPEFTDMAVWEFKVYALKGKQATLSVENIQTIPEIYQIYLIDHTHRRFRNLREEGAYTFVSALDISDFELVVGDQSVINEKLKEVLPRSFSLGRNYPNPFNPVTTIPLTLPEHAQITLKIYNLLGQEIYTLFEGTLQAGQHYFYWHGKNSRQNQMPSGVYIYQMRVKGGERFTEKMVLIK